MPRGRFDTRGAPRAAPGSDAVLCRALVATAQTFSGTRFFSRLASSCFRSIFPLGKIGSSSPCYASPTAADGKIYCISETGQAFVIKASDDKLNVLSSYNFNDKHCFSSIAIADDHIFIRTAHKLFCIGKK